MRIVLALIVVLASLPYFLGFAGIILPAEVELGLHALLVVTGLALLGLEIAAHRRDKGARSEREGAVQRTAQLAEAEAKLKAEVTRLEAACEQERKRAADLGQALRDSKGALARAGHDEAVNLLALLQQKGRFLDFIMDDVTKYPDAQIGAAARVVHQGCSSVVREYFEIRPVHDGAEGASLTLGKDYDAHRYRVIGRVSGEPPFNGRLLHRGWLTERVKLPERIDTARGNGAGGPGIIAPAEVELS